MADSVGNQSADFPNFPDEEDSDNDEENDLLITQMLTNLCEEIRESNIRYIFCEPQNNDMLNSVINVYSASVEQKLITQKGKRNLLHPLERKSRHRKNKQKPLISERKNRRSQRNRDEQNPENCLKRSSRRKSVEYSSESILKNAIVRKERLNSGRTLDEKKYRTSTRISNSSDSKCRRSSRSCKKRLKDIFNKRECKKVKTSRTEPPIQESGEASTSRVLKRSKSLALGPDKENLIKIKRAKRSNQSNLKRGNSHKRTTGSRSPGKRRLSTEHVLVKDVSRGHETIPIQVVNEIDNEVFVKNFQYITQNVFTKKIKVKDQISGFGRCKCKGPCTTVDCMCIRRSAGPQYSTKGRLFSKSHLDGTPDIFECNAECTCNVTCRNRVVQHGINASFQIFKTENKNWGVRTLTKIPKGSYVCEYVGEVITHDAGETRKEDSYLFDLDNKIKESYCIDAYKKGNFARFINHSCNPNLKPVNLFIHHRDKRFPRVVFFAKRDIAALEELGYDYGPRFWNVKKKFFSCSCGEKSCMYRSSI